ncbi:prepilin-type N-terminal cleavage/methylation domain-containing protein [Candidatus Parcubacteria bacterium]|nr:prepilin-type N-terminal cleavage/methylation domain-containing protein [Candidatus Parcubacteria bacterium]
MRSKKGFTVIESLVAIAILVAAITGAMAAVQSGLSSYTFSKDQIIAFYLAQEGFEQIRNIRDENHLSSRNWLYGVSVSSSDPCYFGNACTADGVTVTLARCSAIGSCPVLRQDPTTGFYGLNGAWPVTKFRREIILTSINDHEVAVTVTVDWAKGTVSRQFKARENLFNWQ